MKTTLIILFIIISVSLIFSQSTLLPLQASGTINLPFFIKSDIKQAMTSAYTDFLVRNFSRAESIYTEVYNQVNATVNYKIIGLALLGIGASQGMQSKYNDAINNLIASSKYQQEINNDTTLFQICFNLGLCQFAVLNYDDALNSFKQSISLHPISDQALIGLAETYTRKKEYDSALVNCDRALKLNPKSCDAYKAKGNVYIMQKEYDKALTELAKAIQIDSTYYKAYVNRGLIYANQNELQSAIREYGIAIKFNPRFSIAYNNLASAYDRLGDTTQAIAYYSQAIQVDPRFVLGYRNRAYDYYLTNKLDNAIQDYKKVVELDSLDGLAMVRIGLAYNMKLDKGNATYWFGHALKHQERLSEWIIKMIEDELKELGEK